MKKEELITALGQLGYHYSTIKAWHKESKKTKTGKTDPGQHRFAKPSGLGKTGRR